MVPTFDFQLYLTLKPQHGQTDFVLDAQCRSHAQRLAIMGASGSGKSVMLQVLAGLLPTVSGSLKTFWRQHNAIQHQFIAINQRIYADSTQGIFLTPQQRHVGFMFQDYALFPHLTVAQNIAFGLHQHWHNPSRQHIDEQTQTWLARMQLNHVAQHYPHQISGGQKQRTALARACITQPHCLLLDEPFSALDSHLRQQMRQEVSDLVAELAIPMLLITHDVADCAALAQEVWQMEHGRLRC